jgi:hypothetical protein
MSALGDAHLRATGLTIACNLAGNRHRCLPIFDVPWVMTVVTVALAFLVLLMKRSVAER